MSIATEISRIQQAKADIKTAIEAKGVTVPSSATIDTYDDYVSQISGGVEPTYRWTNSGSSYCDNNGNKEQLQIRELSVDSGTTWYSNTGITQVVSVGWQSCDCQNNLKTDLSGSTLELNGNSQNYTITFYGIPTSASCNTSYVVFSTYESWITADITQKQAYNDSGTVVVHIAANETGSSRYGNFEIRTADGGGHVYVSVSQLAGGGGLESIPYGTDMTQYYGRYIKRIVIGDTALPSNYNTCQINDPGVPNYIDISSWAVNGYGEFAGINSLPIDSTPSNAVELTFWMTMDSSWMTVYTNPFNDLQIEWQ